MHAQFGVEYACILDDINKRYTYRLSYHDYGVFPRLRQIHPALDRLTPSSERFTPTSIILITRPLTPHPTPLLTKCNSIKNIHLFYSLVCFQSFSFEVKYFLY